MYYYNNYYRPVPGYPRNFSTDVFADIEKEQIEQLRKPMEELEKKAAKDADKRRQEATDKRAEKLNRFMSAPAETKESILRKIWRGQDFARKHAAFTHAGFRMLSRNFAAFRDPLMSSGLSSSNPYKIPLTGATLGMLYEALAKAFPGIIPEITPELLYEALKTFAPAALVGSGAAYGIGKAIDKVKSYDQYPGLPDRFNRY